MNAWLGRLVAALRELVRRAPDMAVLADVELSDGVERELPHRLGKVPLAVLAEVTGGEAAVEVTEKTASTVSVQVATTPGAESRTVTLVLLG